MTSELGDYILVVDDTIVNLRILGSILKENKYKVAVVRSAQEALEILSHETPLVILLDVMMPEMDGYELCTILKQTPEYADIPIIFTTAKQATEDILHGFSVGGVDYISKPFNSAELLARVKVQVDLQKAKQTIKQQTADLQKINAAKDRIFSVISHDVRTPLSSLLQLIYASDDIEDDEITIIRQTLREIESTTNETLSMLDNLLHWSRSQMQRIQTKESACDLQSIFEQTVTLYSLVIQKKKLTVSVQKTELPTLECDAEMLKIVFRNLISNAIKFTKMSGNILVQVEQDEHNCKILVQDEGCGVTNEVLTKIFSESQFHTQPGSKGEIGTGLGIKICKLFVELNKGTMGAHNNENGIGCTFWFTLPLYKEKR